MWEKEKMLITSIFSVSHNVFKRFLTQGCKNRGLFGKGLKTDSSQRLNSFPNKPWFLCVCSTSLLKTLLEKKKLLVTSNFSFYYSVFYHFGERSAIFIKFKMSSANSFNLEESEFVVLEKGELTLYHTIQTFNDPSGEAF